MITFPSIRSKLWVRLLSFVVIISVLCPNSSWANKGTNKGCLAAHSRIQLFFSKNDVELSTPQEMALSIAMGQLQKSILKEGKSDIAEEIRQLNNALSAVGMKIITNNVEIDSESKIPYITIIASAGKNSFRAYFLKEDQRKVNKILMIEEKDLRHFDCPGLEGVWFINEERQNIWAIFNDVMRMMATGKFYAVVESARSDYKERKFEDAYNKIKGMRTSGDFRRASGLGELFDRTLAKPIRDINNALEQIELKILRLMPKEYKIIAGNKDTDYRLSQMFLPIGPSGRTIAFSPQGDIFLANGYSQRYIDAEDTTKVKWTMGCKYGYYAVIDGNGNVVVSNTEYDGNIYVLDPDDGSVLVPIMKSINGNPSGMVADSKGDVLIAHNGTIKKLSADDYTFKEPDVPNFMEILGLAVGNNGEIYILNIEREDEEESDERYKPGIYIMKEWGKVEILPISLTIFSYGTPVSIAIDIEGNLHATYGGWEQKPIIRVFEKNTGNILAEINDFPQNLHSPHITRNPDGDIVVSLYDKNTRECVLYLIELISKEGNRKFPHASLAAKIIDKNKIIQKSLQNVDALFEMVFNRTYRHLLFSVLGGAYNGDTEKIKRDFWGGHYPLNGKPEGDSSIIIDGLIHAVEFDKTQTEKVSTLELVEKIKRYIDTDIFKAIVFYILNNEFIKEGDIFTAEQIAEKLGITADLVYFMLLPENANDSGLVEEGVAEVVGNPPTVTMTIGGESTDKEKTIFFQKTQGRYFGHWQGSPNPGISEIIEYLSNQRGDNRSDAVSATHADIGNIMKKIEIIQPLLLNIIIETVGKRRLRNILRLPKNRGEDSSINTLLSMILGLSVRDYIRFYDALTAAGFDIEKDREKIGLMVKQRLLEYLERKSLSTDVLKQAVKSGLFIIINNTLAELAIKRQSDSIFIETRALLESAGENWPDFSLIFFINLINDPENRSDIDNITSIYRKAGEPKGDNAWEKIKGLLEEKVGKVIDVLQSSLGLTASLSKDTLKAAILNDLKQYFENSILGGAIIQGTEARKEFESNRRTGKYQLLTGEFLQIVQRVARENNISLDGIKIYAIQSIIKGKKDFVHGYFDRETGELFLAVNIMEQAKAYDNRHGTKLLDEYIEHELRCRGEDHQELRRKQREKYRRYGNYNDSEPMERFFRNEEQVKILRERARDSGYIYPEDLLNAHFHGGMVSPIIFAIEYPQNGPPKVAIGKGEDPMSLRLIESRIAKAVGEKLSVLDDIEIYYENKWISLRKYFENNPPWYFNDYSSLWNNEPEGMFFIKPDGDFIHVRTDASREFVTNWGTLNVFPKETPPDNLPVALKYYVIANKDLEKSYERVRQWHKKKPLYPNILVIDSEGNGKLFIPKEGALLETAVVNFELQDLDEGRLRDIIREDTDMRDAANQYIETVKSIRNTTQQDQKVVLALDTDLGDMGNNPELLKQIGEVAGLWGNIDFIADSGKGSLEEKISAKVEELREGGVASENIKVIVVTNKKDKFKNYAVTRVEDSTVVNYIPLLEILSFALTLHLEPASTDRLKDLYHAITGQVLGEADIERVRKGELALILPPIEKISPEIYKGAIEVLTSA